MKTRTSLPIVAFTVLLLLLAACGPQAAAPVPAPATAAPIPPTATIAPPTATAVPTVNPISAIVMNMAERFNAGDLDGVMAHYADEAMLYFFGLPPAGTEVYQGKEQIRPVWEDNIANHLVLEVDILTVEDGIVTARVKTWHDFTRELGVAPLEATEIYEIRDGKIVSDAWMLAEESLARVMAALAEAMPAEAEAEPDAAPAETPVSEVTVTIAGGTCSYAGPLTLQAGEVQVTMDVQDQNKTLYALTFFTLDEDKTFMDLMASTVQDGPPPWANMLSLKEIGPGVSETYSIEVVEGPVYGVCWSQPPALPIGAVGPFAVGIATAAPSPEIPDSDIIVTFADGKCAFNSPLDLQAGAISVTLVIEDTGSDGYALTLFNLAPGKNLRDLVKSSGMPAPPAWADMISMQDALTGQIKTYSVVLEAKPLYALCWTTPPDRTVGSMGPVEVSP